MSIKTKMKIRHSGKEAEVFVLINHPMRPVYKEDQKTKKHISAHYIETLHFKLNDRPVADVSLGPAIAANPMIGLYLKNVKAGDQVSVNWEDNRGMKGGAKKYIK